MGIKFQASPDQVQAKTLCEWMGAAKTAWNAKCQDDKYLRKFALKYMPIGTYPEINAEYSKYKDDELTPWLKEVPSQILRNSASSWYFSYKEFFKQKERGRPKIKKRGQGMSIYLTRELFEFQNTNEGLKLFIGTKTNNIGFLKVNWHDKKWLQYGLPNSITVKKLPSGKFTVSFCYGKEDRRDSEKQDRKEWFKHIQKNKTECDLSNEVVGLDRGTVVAVASDKSLRPFTKKCQNGLRHWQNKLKREQVRFTKQKDKKSNRRQKRKLKITKIHAKVANIRDNECHHISRELINDQDVKIYVLENLPTKNLSKSAKGTKENPGKRVKQKSGLNREILNVGWHKIEKQLKYKARLANKVVFKISSAYTSQECADCGHTHSGNRLSRDQFKCVSCGHEDHADTNAAKVIKKRAIKLLLDSGTELSDKGVLRPKDSGRGATVRPIKEKSKKAPAKTAETQRRRQKRKKDSA